MHCVQRERKEIFVLLIIILILFIFCFHLILSVVLLFPAISSIHPLRPIRNHIAIRIEAVEGAFKLPAIHAHHSHSVVHMRPHAVLKLLGRGTLRVCWEGKRRIQAQALFRRETRVSSGDMGEMIGAVTFALPSTAL